MEDFKNLAMSIKDDVRDMKMLADYAKEALEKGDRELAYHFFQKLMTRKSGAEHSHKMVVEIAESRKDVRTECEKIYHECLHVVLIEQMESIEEDIKSLQRKL